MPDELDPHVRALMEEIQREINDWVDGAVIGAVEVGVAFVRAQEMAAAWAERMNVAPLDERLRYLALLHESSFEATKAIVADVQFECTIEPIEDDPTNFSMNVKARERLISKVERIYVTGSISGDGP